MGTNSIGPATTIPALFTSPNNPADPTLAATARADAAICSGLVTSSSTGISRDEAHARIRSPSAVLRTPANTWNFRRSSSSAQASPIPVEAPVIRRVRFMVDATSVKFSVFSLIFLLNTEN